MECILPITGWILVGIGIFLGLGFLVKLLWNWLLPNVSNIKRVTYLQALGILILARLLFGSYGGHGHGWGHHWNHNRYHCSQGWSGCENQKDCKKPGPATKDL